MEDKLTFKERLILYKMSKKPRKQIRLKLQTITAGLDLPKIVRCRNRVNEVFQVNEVAKISSSTNTGSGQFYARKQGSVSLYKQKENLSLLKVVNEASNLRIASEVSHQRLKLNTTLQQLTKKIEARNENIIFGQGLNLIK